MTMNEKTKRMYDAMSGTLPDRVPVAPKIWIDLSATITNTSFEKCIQDPETSLRVIAQAGIITGIDAVRQFHTPAKKTKKIDGKLFEITDKGEIIGEIDLNGGFKTHLTDASFFSIENPVQTAYFNYYTSSSPKIKDISDARRLVIPKKEIYEQLGCGDRQRKIMAEAGDDIAFIGDCCTATMSFYNYARGMQTAMYDLMDNPELVHAVMEKGVEFAVEKGKFNLDMGINILRLNDSVGNMNVISPAQWKEFVFPYIKEVCGQLHEYNPNARIYSHICGNILPVAELLVQTGLDCIGCMDPLGGTTCEKMRDIVGEDVALLGGINPLSFVAGEPQDIIDETRECISAAGKKGRYVISSGCVLPRSSKIENIRALNTAVSKYGIYK
jgi:uroporphyrinogen-III decarboxylase